MCQYRPLFLPTDRAICSVAPGANFRSPNGSTIKHPASPPQGPCASPSGLDKYKTAQGPSSHIRILVVTEAFPRCLCSGEDGTVQRQATSSTCAAHVQFASVGSPHHGMIRNFDRQLTLALHPSVVSASNTTGTAREGVGEVLQ